MLLTQSYEQLGCPSEIVAIGVYYDSVCLKDEQLYGKTKKEHITELILRSKGKLVLNCKFEVNVPTGAHPSYGQIIVSVTGDEYAPEIAEKPTDEYIKINGGARHLNQFLKR